MQYCTKCRALSPEGAGACQSCKSKKVRPVQDRDYVFLQRAREIEGDRMAALFEQNAVRFEREPVNKGRVTSVYDPEYVPGDVIVSVMYEDLPRAQLLLQKQDEPREPMQEQEEAAPVSRVKKAIGSALVTLLFLVLVWLTVMGADAVANFLKSLFTK